MKHSMTMSSRGVGDGELNYPYSVAVDAHGNVYVADWGNHRIQKFGPDGTFLTKWGSRGVGDGQFNYPRSVAVDAKGNVYVSDTFNYRIQKFGPDGAFLAKWGSRGTGDGQFEYPRGVVVDGAGNVYVADSFNHRIQKFGPDGTESSEKIEVEMADAEDRSQCGIGLDVNEVIAMIEAYGSARFEAGIHDQIKDSANSRAMITFCKIQEMLAKGDGK